MTTRLREDDFRALAFSYGVPANEAFFAAAPSEAQIIADKLARPVAIELVADDVVHKSKAGGVRLNVAVEDAARQHALGRVVD